MSSIITQGGASGTGSMTVLAPNTNSNQVVTIPDRTGNIAMDGPAFSASLYPNQSITSNVSTKVTLNTELFDTANAFDSTTNYRFQPLVAGYYQIHGAINGASSTGMTRIFCMLHKNGTQYVQGSDAAPITGGSCSTASAIIYLNGSTDYVELYALIIATTPILYGALPAYTYLSGSLVRAA